MLKSQRIFPKPFPEMRINDNYTRSSKANRSSYYNFDMKIIARKQENPWHCRHSLNRFSAALLQTWSYSCFTLVQWIVYHGPYCENRTVVNSLQSYVCKLVEMRCVCSCRISFNSSKMMKFLFFKFGESWISCDV